jgi:hypothetical protein
MPSDLTIILSKAATPMASATLTPLIARPQEPLTPQQIATVTQVAAAAATTSLRPRSESPVIQIPKRTEPTYTRSKRRRKSDEEPQQNQQQQSLDVSA